MVDPFRPYSRTTLGGLISSKAPPQYTERRLVWSASTSVVRTRNLPLSFGLGETGISMAAHRDILFRTYLSDDSQWARGKVLWRVDIYRATQKPEPESEYFEASPIASLYPGTEQNISERWINPALLDEASFPWVGYELRVWQMDVDGPVTIQTDIWANAHQFNQAQQKLSGLEESFATRESLQPTIDTKTYKVGGDEYAG